MDTSTSSWINKVPQATLIFWLIKMMSTTVGETAADFLNADLHFGLVGTSIVTGLLLAMSLLVQFNAREYRPVRYWVVVLFISVFGTLVTDNLTDNLGVPLAVSSAVFGVALIATFVIWYMQERTLAITSIDTRKREAFYWIAIFFTFALGTAAGDWVAEGFAIGYAYSAVLFGGWIALVAAARFVFKANAVVCFWIAYVLTRPFGASLGDLLSQPTDNGGIGLGASGTSAIFIVAIVALVTYLSLQQKSKPLSSDESSLKLEESNKQ